MRFTPLPLEAGGTSSTGPVFALSFVSSAVLMFVITLVPIGIAAYVWYDLRPRPGDVDFLVFAVPASLLVAFFVLRGIVEYFSKYSVTFDTFREKVVLKSSRTLGEDIEEFPFSQAAIAVQEGIQMNGGTESGSDKYSRVKRRFTALALHRTTDPELARLLASPEIQNLAKLSGEEPETLAADQRVHHVILASGNPEEIQRLAQDLAGKTGIPLTERDDLICCSFTKNAPTVIPKAEMKLESGHLG